MTAPPTLVPGPSGEEDAALIQRVQSGDEEALQQLYRRHAEFFELHDIAEELVEYDERVQLFRYAHLKLAQRIIGGGVVGTMGTPVEVLKQRMEYPLYKALWDVRNEITKHVNAENATGHGGVY